MKLHAHVTVYVPRPPRAVFDAAVASENMSRLLLRFGPIPGVVRVELPEGKQLVAGITRSVFMTDGTTMHEEVIVVLPPTAASPGRHEYRWAHAPAPPFSLLIKGAHAVWTFRAEREGTRVDWYYTFDLTTPLAYVLAAPAIALFRRWMDRALGRLGDLK
jgi:hypothetical protein